MGREKEGLDYFPFDVHFNDEMKLIKAEYGLKAVGLFAILLQKIYGGRGYYAPWDSDVELMFASVNGVGVNFVREVVSALMNRGILSRDIFEQYGVLTSDGIQRRYVEAASRRISKKIIGEYLLISAPKNWDVVYINGENVNINGENVNSQTQSKLKDTTTTISMYSSACARGQKPVENSVTPPLLATVTDHIFQMTDLTMGEARAQANAFITWNAKRGWDCLPDWELAADLWVARIECPRG
jgi:hypothetical protein